MVWVGSHTKERANWTSVKCFIVRHFSMSLNFRIVHSTRVCLLHTHTQTHSFSHPSSCNDVCFRIFAQIQCSPITLLLFSDVGMSLTSVMCANYIHRRNAHYLPAFVLPLRVISRFSHCHFFFVLPLNYVQLEANVTRNHFVVFPFPIFHRGVALIRMDRVTYPVKMNKIKCTLHRLLSASEKLDDAFSVCNKCSIWVLIYFNWM